jgi:hypothetical protein
MTLLRKADYYFQFAVGIIMLLSIPVLFFYGFFAGLFFMGCWQLFSASLNTSSFLTASLSKEIGTYWKWAGIVMACLFLCVPLTELFNADDVQVLGGIAVAASIPVAIYYLFIYKRLLAHLALRKELGGLLKSNH